MQKHTIGEKAISNPALHPFAILLGEWETAGTHPLVAGTILHGHSSFSWIEGGAFLVWYSEIFNKDFPAGTAIFGSDDATGEYFMMYFDERKVSRKYEVSFREGVLKWWRNAPGFSQRYTWTFSGNGDCIIGKGELSKDGVNWEQDLDLAYTRIK